MYTPCYGIYHHCWNYVLHTQYRVIRVPDRVLSFAPVLPCSMHADLILSTPPTGQEGHHRHSHPAHSALCIPSAHACALLRTGLVDPRQSVVRFAVPRPCLFVPGRLRLVASCSIRPDTTDKRHTRNYGLARLG